MNELKPEDVIRALECCSCCDGNCLNDCPLFTDTECYTTLSKNVLYLLREKDALIAKHEAYIDELNDDKEYLVTQIADLQQTVLKKDAQIERLKAKNEGLWEANDLLWDSGREVCRAAITEYHDKINKLIWRGYSISCEQNDQIAKELLGGKK